MEQYDVIIAGAGHNGLTCAGYLAKAGLKVLVVEKEDTVGGACITKEVTLPGFKHDLNSMAHILLRMGPVLKELETEKYGLKYICADPSFGSIFPDGSHIFMYRELEKTCQEIARHSVKDAQNFRRLHEFYLKVKAPFSRILFSPPASFVPLWQLYRKLGKADFLEFLRFASLSTKNFLDEWFESGKVKAWMGAWPTHPGFIPEEAGGSIFALFACFLLQEHGMPIPLGGSWMLAKALADFIQDHGGTIKTGSRVKRIILDGAKAVGIKLENGENIRAKRAVVANIEPKQLFLQLVGKENLSEEFVRKVERFRFGLSSMMIHLALAESPTYSGGEGWGGVGLFHIAPSMDYMSKVAINASHGIPPEEPFLYVSIPSLFDHTKAPPGKHGMWILVRFVPYKISGETNPPLPPFSKGGEGGFSGGKSWHEFKEEYADKCIERLSNYFPNIKRIILKRYVESPLDLEDRNPNLVEADLVGGHPGLFQSLIFRPIPGFSRYRTPIKGLYLCGASSHPGGGVITAPGYNGAQVILGDLSARVRWVRRLKNLREFIT